jgi:hypothetical protein
VSSIAASVVYIGVEGGSLLTFLEAESSAETCETTDRLLVRSRTDESITDDAVLAPRFSRDDVRVDRVVAVGWGSEVGI